MTGVVVLGMHRSGTSALTRVLNLLGAAVPPPEDLLVNYDNPQGHWESRTLVSCNDRILATFGRSWDFPPALAPGWERSPRAAALVPELAGAFASVYPAAPWVWKDPRTCLTFPLWRRALGDGLCILLVLRSAAAVTASVHRRDGIPRPYAAGLWLRYLSAAMEAAAGLPTVCVDFEQFQSAPVPSTVALADSLRTLGVDLPGDTGAAAASVQASSAPAAAGPRTDRVDRLVSSLTRRAAAAAASVPRLTPLASFEPPPLHEPAWVGPFLFAYRGPWAVRARLGHPLGPRFA